MVGLFPKKQTPLLLSQLALCIVLPVLLFGPIAGVLVDRWHKKKVMVFCDSLRMVCAALIPVLFLLTGSIYPVFAVVFFMFLLGLFFNAARNAIIPNLVSRKRILTANSVINLIGRGATFLGFLLGGLIIDWRVWKTAFGIDGWVAAFVIDALSFAISAFMLYIMKVELAYRAPETARLEARGVYLLIRDGLRKIFRDLKDAVKLIVTEKNLLFVIATIFLLIIACAVIYDLVIPTVQQEKAWGTSGIGILAAFGAIGLLLGAYLTGIFGHRFDLKMTMLVCFVVVGIILVAFPFLNYFSLFCALCLIGGIAGSPIFIGQDTLIHRHADEVVRGRIFSLREWIFQGLWAVTVLLIGSLAAFLSKPLLFIIFGTVIIAGALTGTVVVANVKSAPVPSDNV